jgi:hypothetical protein
MTKSLRILLPFCLLLSLAAANSQTAAQKAFATIKTLPGTWEGSSYKGEPIEVTFRTISKGSAVVSEILGKDDMISVFNMDGADKLLLTHYCSTGNQPRMQATVSPDGKTFTFTFIDVTNLATPDAGRMQSMVLTLVDENHHTENWTFLDHGHQHTESFDLHRKL